MKRIQNNLPTVFVLAVAFIIQWWLSPSGYGLLYWLPVGFLVGYLTASYKAIFLFIINPLIWGGLIGTIAAITGLIEFSGENDVVLVLILVAFYAFAWMVSAYVGAYVRKRLENK